MRIAIISDIHGNILALEAVLADIARRGVERVVNLGDILSGPLWPVETAERLMALDLPTIRGNHERQLLDQPPERMGASDRHTRLALAEPHLDWIARLPATLALSPEVLMVHGTPTSDLDYFLQTVTADGLRAATPAEIAERAEGADFALILCGHTHLAGSAVLADGRILFNPGSVGLPAYGDDQPFPHVVESGTPHARYGIVERGEAGWTVQPIRIEYDLEAAARQAEANARPDWAIALRTGHM